MSYEDAKDYARVVSAVGFSLDDAFDRLSCYFGGGKMLPSNSAEAASISIMIEVPYFDENFTMKSVPVSIGAIAHMNDLRRGEESHFKSLSM
jgi:hypothetical protein